MGEIAEEAFTERVIAHVLDGASAVGVGVRYDQLMVRRRGESGEQKRAYGVIPGEIDEFFVSEDGVGGATCTRKDQCWQQDEYEGNFAKHVCFHVRSCKIRRHRRGNIRCCCSAGQLRGIETLSWH